MNIFRTVTTLTKQSSTSQRLPRQASTKGGLHDLLDSAVVVVFAAILGSLLVSACKNDQRRALNTERAKAASLAPANNASARAQLARPSKKSPDGKYAAKVSTWTATYSAPVKVASGRVVSIHWPKWGDVSVTGGALTGDFAEAVTAHGEMVKIELESRLN